MAYNVPETIRRILTNSPFNPQYLVVDVNVPDYPPGDGPNGTVGKPYRSIQAALNAAPAIDPFNPFTWFLILRIMPGVYDEDVVVSRYGIVGFQTEGMVFIGNPGFGGPPPVPRSLIWRVDAPPGPPPPLPIAFFYTSSSVMPWDGPEFSNFGAGALTITGNVLIEGDSQLASSEERGILLSSCAIYGDPNTTPPDGYAFTFSTLQLSGVVGTYNPGDTITSVPSGCLGRVVSWSPTGPGTGYLEVRRLAGPPTGFAVADTIATLAPGGTGTVDPGGVIIAGGVIGNDGSINDIAGTHKALGGGLALAMHLCLVGQDTGGPNFGSVIIPQNPALTNVGVLLHETDVQKDVINEGPFGAGPPSEPLTRLEAENSKINGRVSVPNGLVKFENGMKVGDSSLPVGHDFKVYNYIKSASIAGPISITGAAADFFNSYHPIYDSDLEGPITVLPGVLQIDRVTEYYLTTFSTLPAGTIIIETGGGGGGSVGAFTDLSDVPHSYVGQEGLFPRVNASSTGLEFAGASGFIRIVDVTVPGGVADNKTYQDTANTVLESCRVSGLSILVTVKASYPKVSIGATTYYLTEAVSGGHYTGVLATTLPGAGTLTVNMKTPDEVAGTSDSIAVTHTPPPTILTLSFTGGYPGVQTELKFGDTFQITGTTDVAADGVEIVDFGAGSACVGATIAFASNTTFTVTGTIANRGDVVQSLPARLRAKSAVTGAYGPTRDTNTGGGSVDGTDLVKCNNLHPSVTWGAVTYPVGQGALKNAETATVGITVLNSDTTIYSSPTGQLNVVGFPPTVQRIGGTYNVSVDNLRATATRNANAATTIANTLVKIAHVAAVITITNPAARLRSGGNDGTSAQDHTITIVSDQELYVAPTMSAGVGGGTLQGVAWVGGPSNWTRALRVHDNDVKGTYNWNTLTAQNLANITTSVISGSTAYVLGGFVQRSLTFGSYLQTTTMNVEVITYTKLQAGTFTATGQPANRNAVQGDTSNIVDTFTVTALGANPTTLYWNDASAASTNSSGTAQITLVEEVV